MTVIVRQVGAQDGLEVASSEDEDAIEALTTERAPKPLRQCIRPWRLDRGADDC